MPLLWKDGSQSIHMPISRFIIDNFWSVLLRKEHLPSQPISSVPTVSEANLLLALEGLSAYKDVSNDPISLTLNIRYLLRKPSLIENLVVVSLCIFNPLSSPESVTPIRAPVTNLENA